MKIITAFFLSLAMGFTLTACGSAANSTVSVTSNGTGSTAQMPAAAPIEPPEDSDTAADTAAEEAPESGKTLVVYYSASGSTARVAETIAAAVNADLFEIVPTEAYTDDDLDWTNLNSRVSREHDDETLRDVPLTSAVVVDWADFDTVFIGYPIWWGIAAWPVDNFVKGNDFTGKTVIPFATSASSGMGESGTLLSEMAGSGDWQEGHRFSSGASAADVQRWVEGLGL